MAFTGNLGQSNAVLGLSFALGRADPTSVSTDQTANSVIVFTQTVGLHGITSHNITSTLSLTQVGSVPPPLVPVVGYSGGQARLVHVKDTTHGQVLYALNPDTLFTYPGSIAKLMTALLIMEYKGTVLTSESVTVQSGDLSYSGASTSLAGLEIGDITDWEGLLYAIFLPSGADACNVAGRIIGDLIYANAGNTGNFGLTRFIERMNARAGELGLVNTFFYTAFGYSQTGGTVRTTMSAREASVLCYEAFSYSAIRVIAGSPTRDQVITGVDPRTIHWLNYNRFVNGPTLNQSGIKDDNVIGGKNGTWIDGSGYYNLTQLWTAPNGNEVVITVFGAETLLALTYDVQGIIYSLIRDWPYLATGIAIPDDPSFGNVKLLIGGDGSIVDESIVGRALTNNSVTVDNPVIDSPGGLLFNAASDHIRATNDDADLQIGSGDGTIEVWWQAPTGGVTSLTGEDTWFSKAQHTPSVKREWLLDRFNNWFQIFVSVDGTNWTSAVAFSLGTEELKVFYNGAPRHFAMVKEGTTWTLYINGERSTATLTGNVTNSDAYATLGYYASAGSTEGFYDDYRITVGVARYSDNKVTLSARKFARALSLNQTADNTLSLSQTVELHGTINRSVSNDLVLTQTKNAISVHERSVSNTLAFTERAQRCYTPTGSNTVTFTQSVVDSRGIHNSLTLSHSVGLALIVGRNLPQNLTLTQTTARNVVVTKTASNTLSLTQRLKRIIPLSVSSTLSLSETLSGYAGKPAHNNLTVTGQATVVHANGRHVSNTLNLTQSVNCVKIFVRPVVSILAFTQVERNAYPRTVVQTLHLTQNAYYVLSKKASNDLTLTQDVVEDHYKYRRVFADLNLTESVVDNWVFDRHVSNTLTLTQSVRRILEESVTSTLALTHSNTVVNSKNVIQSLALTQSVVGARVYGRSVSQTLAFTEDVDLLRVISKRMLSLLQLSHHGRLIPVRNRSASNNLVLSEELHKEVFADTTNNFVTLSQSVSVVRVRNFNITHTIGLQDTMNRNIVKYFNKSDNLTFYHDRVKDIRIGNLTQITIPDLIVTVTPTPEGQGYVTTTPTIRRQRQIMTISVPGRTVILPVPLFGNKEGNTDQFTMSYSIDGDVYTTVKKSGTRAISFDWDLALNKAEELKEFVWDHNSKAMQINTWNGEIWIVRMTTNPVGFTDSLRPDPADESNSHVQVALEFEGVRIH